LFNLSGHGHNPQEIGSRIVLPPGRRVPRDAIYGVQVML